MTAFALGWPLEVGASGYKPLPIEDSFYRDGYGTTRSNPDGLHLAIDLRTGGVVGVPVLAPEPGFVCLVDPDPGGGEGKVVGVRGAYSGWIIAHFHCADVIVKPGQTVGLFQRLAHVGMTGSTTGPHDHIEAAQPGTRLPYARVISIGDYLRKYRDPRVNLLPFLLQALRERRWRAA
jgi:murein DD-endopeptidase MepM/ murein hydrolase activator NlpD